MKSGLYNISRKLKNVWRVSFIHPQSYKLQNNCAIFNSKYEFIDIAAAGIVEWIKSRVVGRGLAPPAGAIRLRFSER